MSGFAGNLLHIQILAAMQERQQELEHTTRRTRGRDKFHHATGVCCCRMHRYQARQIVRLQSHNAIANCTGAVQVCVRDAVLKEGYLRQCGVFGDASGV